MKMNNPILEAALHYADMGMSVIPVGENKKPLITEWKSFQSKRASKAQIEDWFLNIFPTANVAVVTGAISGIVVVDVEKGGNTANLPPTVISKTGGGGWHYFYKHPGCTVRNAVRLLDKTDIRGDGGYVVMPPSLHQSGQQYEWLISSADAAYEEMPLWILEKLSPVAKETKTDWEELLKKVNPEGTRNATAAQVAGKLLYHIPMELWDTAGWAAFEKLNEKNNQPPLAEAELRNVWESIKKRESARRVMNMEKPTGNFAPLSLSDLMKKEYGEIPWVVERLIPHEAITVISGAPAAYKTWLMLDIALAVSAGKNFCERFTTTQSPVLIIDEENGERILQQRIKMLSGQSSLPIYFLPLRDFRLTDSSVKGIIEVAGQLGIKLVILDSLVRIHGADENDATKMAGVFKHLKELTKNGIGVLVTHHNRKEGLMKGNPSQEMRGSSDILASVDCHLSVKRKTKEDYVVLTQTKLRQAQELKPFKLNILSDKTTLRFEHGGQVDDTEDKKGDCKEAIKDILAEHGKPLSRKELFNLVGEAGLSVGYSTFKTVIKGLMAGGEMIEKKGVKNEKLCSLPEFTADDG